MKFTFAAKELLDLGVEMGDLGLNFGRSGHQNPAMSALIWGSDPAEAARIHRLMQQVDVL